MLKKSKKHSLSSVRLLAGFVVESSTQTWVDITRTGTFSDKRYGTFDIEPTMLSTIVDNFNKNTVGQKIFIDLNHQPEGGAAGEVLKLAVMGDRLRAKVAWTTLGLDAIKTRRMIYLSMEYVEHYKDNEKGNDHGAVLLGAALTTRPVIKHLNHVTLAMKHSIPVLLHKKLIKKLAASNQPMDTNKKDKSLTADDVKKLLAEHEASKQEAAKTLAEVTAARITVFDTIINEASDISDQQKKTLCEDAKPLLASLADDMAVKALATMQLDYARELAVAQQLSGMGYTAKGSPRIVAGEDNTAKALQQTIDKHAMLPERKNLHPFVGKVLAQFDRTYGRELASEAKMLAGGVTGMGDSNLPAGYRRTVIREALSDLNILNLVHTMTDFDASGSTVQIPYEVRDTSAVVNDGIVYEGQGIPGASMRQDMDTAYINAMKISLKISNEVAFFSRNNRNIDWDAYARNLQSNARVIRELFARRVANTMQRVSDGYNAIVHTADDVSAQFNGTASMVKTTFFPIVRPHQVRDLKGSTIGNPIHPIVATFNGAVIAEYNGTGSQPAATYYRIISYNMGYIQLVNAVGFPVAPAANATLLLDYSEPRNVVKFNLDNGTTPIEDHLNGLLRIIGSRKAVMTGDRFISPDKLFMLMSPTLNNMVTNARAFVESQARYGTELSKDGDLSMIKSIPSYGTNAPAIDLGDERIIIGEAGVMAYDIVKPFETGIPFESVDANGLPTGEKVAYGEEYSAIHVPLPLHNRLTSVLAYSAAGR